MRSSLRLNGQGMSVKKGPRIPGSYRIGKMVSKCGNSMGLWWNRALQEPKLTTPEKERSEPRANTQLYVHKSIWIHKCKTQYLFLRCIYLFMRDTEQKRDRGRSRGRSRLPAGSPIRDSIPISQRQTLNPWATQASQNSISFMVHNKILSILLVHSVGDWICESTP